MAVYTVHQPPVKAGQTSKAGQTPADPDRFAFVRDGFHFWAFVLSPLWMIRRRLWLVLVLYVALTVTIEVALEVLGASDAAQFIVAVLIGFLVGLEAGTLRRWTLTRRGWRNIGTVVGDDLEEAERRFFAAWIEPVAPRPIPAAVSGVPTVTSVTAAYAARRNATDSDIVGLFPEPGAPR
jgi:hypothetical protein